MTSPAKPGPGSAPLYDNGVWTVPDKDPIDARYLLNLRLPTVIASLGYTLFTEVRHQDSAPLGLSLYCGPPTADPRWIIVLEAPACAEGQDPRRTFVYARHIGDVMALLGQWAPVVHDLAAAELAAVTLLQEEENDVARTIPLPTEHTSIKARVDGEHAGSDVIPDVIPDEARQTGDDLPPGAPVPADPAQEE